MYLIHELFYSAELELETAAGPGFHFPGIDPEGVEDGSGSAAKEQTVFCPVDIFRREGIPTEADQTSLQIELYPKFRSDRDQDPECFLWLSE